MSSPGRHCTAALLYCLPHVLALSHNCSFTRAACSRPYCCWLFAGCSVRLWCASVLTWPVLKWWMGWAAQTCDQNNNNNNNPDIPSFYMFSHTRCLENGCHSVWWCLIWKYSDSILSKPQTEEMWGARPYPWSAGALKNSLNSGWMSMLEKDLLHCQFAGSGLIYCSVFSPPEAPKRPDQVLFFLKPKRPPPFYCFDFGGARRDGNDFLGPFWDPNVNY